LIAIGNIGFPTILLWAYLMD